MENILNELEVIKFLVNKGGRCTNFELVSNFRGVLNDPRYQAEARLKFKDIINSVATVGEFQNVKFIELKTEFGLKNGVEPESQPSSLTSDCSGYTSPISQSFQPYWRYRLSSSKRLPPPPPRSPEPSSGAITYHRSVSESALPRNHIGPELPHHAGHDGISPSHQVPSRRQSSNISQDCRINDIDGHQMANRQHHKDGGIHNRRMSANLTPESNDDRMSQSLPFYSPEFRNTAVMHTNDTRLLQRSSDQHPVNRHAQVGVDRRQSTNFPPERYDGSLPFYTPEWNTYGHDTGPDGRHLVGNSTGVTRGRSESQRMKMGNNRSEEHKSLPHDSFHDNSNTNPPSYAAKTLESHNAYEGRQHSSFSNESPNTYSLLDNPPRKGYQNDGDESQEPEMSSQLRNVSRTLFKSPKQGHPKYENRNSMKTRDSLHSNSRHSDSFEQPEIRRNAGDLQGSEKAIHPVYNIPCEEYSDNDSYLHSNVEQSPRYSKSPDRISEPVQNSYYTSKGPEMYDKENLHSSHNIPNSDIPYSKHGDTQNMHSRPKVLKEYEESTGNAQFEPNIPYIPEESYSGDNLPISTGTEGPISVYAKGFHSSQTKSSLPSTPQHSEMKSISGSMASLDSEKGSSNEKDSNERETECPPPLPPPRKQAQSEKLLNDQEAEGEWSTVTPGGKVRDRVQHFDDMEKKRNVKRSHSPLTPGKENKIITPKGIGTDDEVSISVIETKLKREWNVKAAQCDYHALIGLLKKEPKLAALKGYTALHWAAKQGDANVVKLIAGAYKISPNIRSNGGYTPLHLATLFKHNLIVHLLVHTYGADPSIRDFSGKRADQYPANYTRIVAGHKTSERRPLKVRASEQQQLSGVKEQPSGGVGSSFMRIGSLNLRKSRKSAVFASVRGRNWGSASELRQGSRVSMRKKLQRNLLHTPEKKWETDKKNDSDADCTFGFPPKKQEYV